ncbi:MAG: lysine--tRNA ligase [Pseudomonadota bacterium]
MWADKIIRQVPDDYIVINDSKTPSGRVHVGSLRGVLIHDALYRALSAQGKPALYIYGIDDYDPMDGLPADADPAIRQYMGMPLCQVPAPAGSSATDMADHYISEFLQIFRELGVAAQTYRMRDVYQGGLFNEVIDILLHQAARVRDIYAQVSGAQRPDDWYPLQVICEQCGRIGTTQVTGYQHGLVDYQCRPDLVSWAQGCGHRGRISPFDGRAKLPWKLEWAAKWHEFGISIEGAGKDHCTKGGSRDVASMVLRRVLHSQPPVNVPYEFFLVGGAKMSSSKGLGAAARTMADLLPPEVLRFLMIRTDPKKAVNFSTDAPYLVKLYNDFDRLLHKVQQETADQEDQQLFASARVAANDQAYAAVNFQLLMALLQIPHLDAEQEVAQRLTDAGHTLTAQDYAQIRARIRSAGYWLEHFATDEDKFSIQETLPAGAQQLDAAQRYFLHTLADRLIDIDWHEAAIQTCIFEVARHTPLSQAQAFAAIYQVILGKAQGPKAGALLSFLAADFVLPRLRALPYAPADFVQQVSITTDQLAAQLAQTDMTQIQIVPECYVETTESAPVYYAVAAVRYVCKGKTHTRRLLLETTAEPDSSARDQMILSRIQEHISILFCAIDFDMKTTVMYL